MSSASLVAHCTFCMLLVLLPHCGSCTWLCYRQTALVSHIRLCLSTRGAAGAGVQAHLQLQLLMIVITSAYLFFLWPRTSRYRRLKQSFEALPPCER